MADFFDDLQATAIELITEFGAEATLHAGDGSEKAKKVMVCAMKSEHAVMQGMTISAQQRAFYISPESAIIPEPGDYLTFGKGKAFTLLQTMDLTPNLSTTVYYGAVGS